MTESLTGGCLCGAVRYRADASQTLHYMCHCTDCRKHSGTAFHAAIVVAADELEVAGEPQVYTKQADSGRTIARYFCGDCGGHLFTSPWPEATRYSLKAGTLDDSGAFDPKHEIWRQSLVPWALPSTDHELLDQGFTRPVSIGSPSVNPDQDKF